MSAITDARDAGAVTRNAKLPTYTQAWDPVQRHNHCSNCRHCIVSQGPGELMAQCEMGLGRADGAARPLANVIKPTMPYGWAATAKCPSFQCMTDDCAEHDLEAV